jgi:hypothetical protein
VAQQVWKSTGSREAWGSDAGRAPPMRAAGTGTGVAAGADICSLDAGSGGYVVLRLQTKQK